MRTVLITGGAGFAGSALGLSWKRDFPEDRVIALDNLVRAGSELNPPRLAAAGVEFFRGDVRRREDLESLRTPGGLDLVIDCAAEPSVRAGYEDDNRYLVDTNFTGALNCLDLARARGARFMLLSTSRVYPLDPLRALPLREGGTRLFLPEDARGTGWSAQGVTEKFPLEGHRSLYGATKLAAELFVQEYAAAYRLEAVVNRLGVLAGPWQMGKVDQGFLALWASRFLYGGSLSYTGFGGEGMQVRDILHVADLYDLVRIQAGDFSRHAGKTYNAGGGPANSVSLRELSGLCEAFSGNRLSIGSRPETHPADIPYYVTDNTLVTQETGWAPKRSVNALLEEVFQWLRDERPRLEALFLKR